MHGATTLAELGYDGESKGILIEANGTTYIVHVQRRFKDAINPWANSNLQADYPTVSDPGDLWVWLRSEPVLLVYSGERDGLSDISRFHEHSGLPVMRTF